MVVGACLGSEPVGLVQRVLETRGDVLGQERHVKLVLKNTEGERGGRGRGGRCAWSRAPYQTRPEEHRGGEGVEGQRGEGGREGGREVTSSLLPVALRFFVAF